MALNRNEISQLLFYKDWTEPRQVAWNLCREEHAFYTQVNSGGMAAVRLEHLRIQCSENRPLLLILRVRRGTLSV